MLSGGYDNLGISAGKRLETESKLARIQQEYDEHTFLHKLDRRLVEEIRLKKDMIMREKEGRRLRDLAMFEEIEKVVLLEKCKQLLTRNHQLEELVEKLADDNALLRRHGARLSEQAQKVTSSGLSFGKEAAFMNIGKDTDPMLNRYYKDEQTDTSLRAQLADQKDKIEELLRANTKLEQEKKALNSQLEYKKQVIIPQTTQITLEPPQETQLKLSQDYEKRPLASPLVVSVIHPQEEARQTSAATRLQPTKSEALKPQTNMAETLPRRDQQNYAYSTMYKDGNKTVSKTVEKTFGLSSDISRSEFLSDNYYGK